MPGFNGTGPNGMGPMTGGGRGFCSPWGAGVRNFAFPRWAPYPYPRYGAYGLRPFAPRVSREQELEFLKDEAQELRRMTEEINARIGELTGNSK